MYIAIEIETNNILNINRAPLKQELMDKQVFYAFDPNLHKVLRGDRLPEHWKDVDGFIVEKTLQEKVDENIEVLEPTQKIEDNEIVEKTDQEKVGEGLLDIQTFRDNKKVERKEHYKLVLIEALLNDSSLIDEYTIESNEIDQLNTIQEVREYKDGT